MEEQEITRDEFFFFLVNDHCWVGVYLPLSRPNQTKPNQLKLRCTLRVPLPSGIGVKEGSVSVGHTVRVIVNPCELLLKVSFIH